MFQMTVHPVRMCGVQCFQGGHAEACCHNLSGGTLILLYLLVVTTCQEVPLILWSLLSAPSDL